MRLALRVVSLLVIISFLGGQGLAQSRSDGPLQIEINEGIIQLFPIAAPQFIAESAGTTKQAEDITDLILSNLERTGLFRIVPESSHIGKITNFDSPVQFSDWKAINVDVLLTGAVAHGEDGNLVVKIRLHDVFAESSLGQGVLYRGTESNWRRLAHKISDVVYSRITGEGGYFDTRIAFISEFGAKTDRTKRLTIMDYDGANVRFLTDGTSLVLAPRFSPEGDELIYTSYRTGKPSVFRLNLRNGRETRVLDTPDMTFSPRFSPDGKKVMFSRTTRGNTDIYETNLATNEASRITRNRAIDTAPTYSPDGKSIAFESDRSGTTQIYTMNLRGGNVSRISFGDGTYGTPVWSPRGDYIAFTKQDGNIFHIGVMLADGTEERLLSRSFLDEGPTWAPNGRVLLFFREEPGERGGPSLYSVDVTGRNLTKLDTPNFASDPTWSPLR